MALAALTACQKESDVISASKGVELTISASVASPADTRTTYTYTPGTQAGTIDVAWEATEYLTVVSIGESGITAVDEFVSTGDAGRTKAEFTGTWNGSAGDKVICLYPAITTTAGAARYSGVEAGSTSIGVNFPAHAPSTNISTIKDYDLMIGDVAISGTAASVTMERKISVLRLGISGAYYWDGDYGYKITEMGVSAMTSSNIAKLFVNSGTVAMTKSTYSGEIVPVSYQPTNRNTLSPAQYAEGVFDYYLPVIADGNLEAGDKLEIAYKYNVRYSNQDPWESNITGTKTSTIASTLTFAPGYVYAINAEL